MPSSCYVQVCGGYANRNAGISLHLNLIENKNRVVWVWFVNTHLSSFQPNGALRYFPAHIADQTISVSKGVTLVLVTKASSLRRLKNDVDPSKLK